MLAAVILFFVARAWLSSLAVLLTMTAPLVPLLGVVIGADSELSSLFECVELSVDSLMLSQLIFSALLIFLAFCCRSWLSLGLTLLLVGGVLGLLFIPGVSYSYVLLGVAGALATAGVRSLKELHRLTFGSGDAHWQQELPDTDMVFASRELGGDPRYWYWLQTAVAISVPAAVLTFAFVV